MTREEFKSLKKGDRFKVGKGKSEWTVRVFSYGYSGCPVAVNGNGNYRRWFFDRMSNATITHRANEDTQC